MARITYEQRIEWALDVVSRLRDYLPLTLRQIFYQMVAALYIPNTQSQYKSLSAALARARKEGLIPWGVIEDRTRPLYGNVGWQDAQEFLELLMEGADSRYQRNLMRGQPCYIELFVEKQALVTPFSRAAEKYHLFVNMGRGYSSVTVLKRMADRLGYAEDDGYEALVLAFSDLDPSGVDLVDNLSRQFWDFGIGPEVKRIALTKAQIEEYDLPHNPEALKMTDSRAMMFLALHGQYAVELDALDPPTLEDMVHGAVEERLDMALFEGEVAREEEEREEIAERVEEFLGG